MATLEFLQAKIKKLEQQAEALVTKQASGVIEKIRELMAEHGLTTADIKAHERSKGRLGKTGTAATSKKSVVAFKYRDPKSGATWSGRGRAPLWIAGAKNRDKFLVDSGAAIVKSASAGKAKVTAKKASKTVGARSGKGQPKGPQPALYRDPKSGATWSGRGRAPGWIAGATDRKKYLIG
ncbi:histone-like nucleoid-structuring protein H-NS [Caballeronia sordidicola]|uniref:Histone-like nucleoid-structuring protein H-NS n=1 Tax=Caballeronia sordidicola TaxID=196367 RepID=A0A158FFD3_CABSO|nr:H-NS family nucleoid-associated regulatory protein [Caballeronia sordidicola]SAL18558.1 histone-like nucleoid-structuring protein H-NS [Caballeronia sordidicola]